MTAAALMVGVTLVSLTAIVASSVRASIGSIIDSAIRADFVITSGSALGGSGGFSPRLERSLAALPQVRATAGLRSGVVKIAGQVASVVATDPAQAAPLFNLGVTRGHLGSMTARGIAVSAQAAASHHLTLGSPVRVTFASNASKTYTVQVIYSVRDVTGDYILPLAAARAYFPQALDVDVFVKLAPGVGAQAGRHAVGKVLASYPSATLQDQVQYKAQQSQQVNQLLNLIYGLLALAVIIAFIGIANTLALSVHERTRELGLLRAVGTTRGQLRSIVRAEALIISLFGALEGLLLGIIFGWAIVAVLRSKGRHDPGLPGRAVVRHGRAGRAGRHRGRDRAQPPGRPPRHPPRRHHRLRAGQGQKWRRGLGCRGGGTCGAVGRLETVQKVLTRAPGMLPRNAPGGLKNWISYDPSSHARTRSGTATETELTTSV